MLPQLIGTGWDLNKKSWSFENYNRIININIRVQIAETKSTEINMNICLERRMKWYEGRWTPGAQSREIQPIMEKPGFLIKNHTWHKINKDIKTNI